MHALGRWREAPRLFAATTILLSFAGWMAPVIADVNPEAGDYDWGCLASRFTDIHGDVRERLLGPFIGTSESSSGVTFRAVRPVVSRYANPDAKRITREILWPLCINKSVGEMETWRAVLLYSLNWDRGDPTSRSRFWILPVYFQGRDADGESYRAVFPLGGKVREFLGQDEISFFLFPFRIKSSINEVTTRHILWPLYMRTSGKGVYRFRLFPFYMQSRLRDNYVKRSVMWPFYSQAEFFYPEASGFGYIVFPLWGHIKLTAEETWMAIPPLFRRTRTDQLTSMYLPYPFFQYSSGRVEKLYFFPIWGEKTRQGSSSSFFLWPIFDWLTVNKGDEVFRRFNALPLWYSHEYRLRAESGGDPGAVTRRYAKLWPLVSFQKDGEVRRWRSLELWPRKFDEPIERNFAPFWTLYQRTVVGDALETEALWGVFRHHRKGRKERYLSLFPLLQYRRVGDENPEHHSFSLFKGLFRYEEKKSLRSWRFLYVFRFGNENG